MVREDWRVIVLGVAKSQTRLSSRAHTLLSAENRFGTRLEFFRSSHSAYPGFDSAGNSEFSGKLQRRFGFGVTGDTKLGGRCGTRTHFPSKMLPSQGFKQRLRQMSGLQDK